MSLVSQIEATTQKYHDKELKDCTKFRSYYLTKLLGRSREFVDGRSYTWPVKYARVSTQWLAEYEKQERSPTEQITQAEEPYVFSSTACVLSEQELKKNQGKERILNLLSKKLSMLRDDVEKDLSTAIWTGDASKEPRGILSDTSTAGWIDMSADTGSQSGTVAGIVRGTDDTGSGLFTNWWQAHVDADIGGDISEDWINQLIQGCSHDKDAPDLLISGKTVHQYVYNIATGLEREPHSDAAKLGFKSISINGIPYVWDEDCGSADADAIFAFNMKDHGLYFLKGSKMHRTEWFKPQDQRAIVCDMINDLTFVVEVPRNQGGYGGITG